MLPDYISKAVPNPASNRAPWYTNTAPSYAGIFLWVVFYMEIAVGTIDRAGIGLSMLALAGGRPAQLRSLLSRPGHAGDADRLPLVRGRQFDLRHQGRLPDARPADGPAASGLVLGEHLGLDDLHPEGLRIEAGPGPCPSSRWRAIWAYAMAYVGVKGIQYVAKFSLYLNMIPLLMILVVFFKTASGVPQFVPPESPTLHRFHAADPDRHRLLRHRRRGRRRFRHEQP